MSHPPVLTAQEVEFHYGMPVLDRLSLEVREGECLGILGTSGAGKSTLLKVLAGLRPPSRGRVEVFGHDLYRLKRGARRQVVRRMAMAFQRSGLFDSLTCGDNLRFPLEMLTELDEAAQAARIRPALEEVGLGGQEDTPVSAMSGGMQKRLGIARALITEPSLVFYDDPTAGLDPLTARSINELINEANQKRKMTSVVVTSDPLQSFQLADRTAFLHQGRILAIGTEEEIRQSQDPSVHQFLVGGLEGPLTEGVW